MKNYNKVLDPADFQEWGIKSRKQWEIQMAFNCLHDHKVLKPSAEIVGVGAGQEATIFMLSNEVKRVFATDLYLTPGMWSQHAPLDMMINPSKCARNIPHNPRRIVPQHADMLNLPYEDDTFDGAFSSGSIEHVGSYEKVAQAIREIARVVKPCGVISLSTEWKLSGLASGWDPNVLLFDHETLLQYIVEPSGCEYEGISSPAILDAEPYPFIEIVHGRRPAIEMVLEHEGYVFTSVHIVLIKPKKARRKSA